MKSEPTEKTKGKKMAVSETADRKNGRSPGAGHDEWWERLMMEPGPGESAGTDASVTESMIPSGLVAEEVSGEAGRKDTPPEPVAIVVYTIIYQMTMRIVGVMMPYQDELGILNAHQFHILQCDFSHKLIG